MYFGFDTLGELVEGRGTPRAGKLRWSGMGRASPLSMGKFKFATLPSPNRTQFG